MLITEYLLQPQTPLGLVVHGMVKNFCSRYFNCDFTATTSSETITATGTVYSFYNLTFGETSGAATWALSKPFDINGSLAINYGTMARGTTTITITGNLSIGTSGFITGLATTTFDGTGSNTWSDESLQLLVRMLVMWW